MKIANDILVIGCASCELEKKTAEKIIICEALDVQALLWYFICMELVLEEAGYKLIIPDKTNYSR